MTADMTGRARGVTVPDVSCSLEAISIEHLRGFDRATLALTRQNTVLVGPNNSGKTSMLLLLHWALTGADDELLSGRRQLTTAEEQLLVPARETRGAARRITLSIRVSDGRRARRFGAVDNVAHLRLQFRSGGVFAALGQPRRSEPTESSKNALELLAALRNCLAVTYVGSNREAGSRQFEDALRGSIRDSLADRLLHQDRGGAPAEYRKARQALKDIESLAKDQAAQVWELLESDLPAGMTRLGGVAFDVSPSDLVDWLTDRATLSVSTGAHDARMVPPVELGSGLQSLLLMGLLTKSAATEQKRLLLLEEPESFLHPSAQRALARRLFDAQDVKLVTSTHSTVVVDESVAADVVLVRGHRIYSPADTDDRRRAINSALLTGQGSEAIFSRSVLLVEGPGDRAFFETLRRRMADFLPPGPLGNLGIVAVGGKTRFGPWVQLLESYQDRHSGYNPIEYLVVADGVDASTDVAAGVRAGGISIPIELDRRFRDASVHYSAGDMEGGRREMVRLNVLSEAVGFPVCFLPVDLEHAALSKASIATSAAVAKVIGVQATDSHELMRRLGSKIDGPASNASVKHDWTRAEIAHALPWEELTPDVRRVLRRWVEPVVEDAGLRMPGGLQARVRSSSSRGPGSGP